MTELPGAADGMRAGHRRRSILIGTIAVAAAGLFAWQGGALPIRWRYADIRAAERVIRGIEDFRQKNGRYPSIDEVDFGTDNFGYDVQNDGYQLTVTVRLDRYYVYDSRDRRWKRSGVVPVK